MSNIEIDGNVYAEVTPLDDALNGEKCLNCGSNKTRWRTITSCEVEFACSGCNESFFIEDCFLSDTKQKAIREARP